MDETIKTADEQHLDAVYPQAEFEKDLMHYDVVRCYQKKLETELGHAVDYEGAEFVAYGWLGTEEDRTEKLRQRYASQ